PGGESSRAPAVSPPVSPSDPSQSRARLSPTPSSPDPLSQTSAARIFVVLVKAREDSWLSISIDGEVSTQTVLTASAEKSVRAEKEIIVKAGNMGALDFEFN